MNTEKIFFKDNQHFKDTFVHCTRKQCINNQYCMSVRVRNLWDTTTIIEYLFKFMLLNTASIDEKFWSVDYLRHLQCSRG